MRASSAPSILIVVDVAVPDCLPHMPHLKLHLHDCGPLDVVGLGEGGPPTAGTDVPDHRLEGVVAGGAAARTPARSAATTLRAAARGAASAAGCAAPWTVAGRAAVQAAAGRAGP